METKTKRTLVKSAPELWELASDLARMEAWMGGLVGSPKPVPIEITASEAERVLAWRCTESGAYARIAIDLAESGFGTAVEITAQHSQTDTDAAATLEDLLDELGSPERRPFARA